MIRGGRGIGEKLSAAKHTPLSRRCECTEDGYVAKSPASISLLMFPSFVETSGLKQGPVVLSYIRR